MRVGTLEETITVTGESPIVDTQAITQRHVMTRDVLDMLPTGRNIQAVGIMIPGTTLALGGGGALSRDVGGSGQMQQSPLQYRGSADTVQTIEGLRLNNLCAQGAYSGVYWNDASFEEISYITGADSAEMGQGGMRVNMVPRDGGNQFRGQFFGELRGRRLGSRTTADRPASVNACARARRTSPAAPRSTRTTSSPTSRRSSRSGTSTRPSAARSSATELWFYYTFRNWGTHKTKVDSLLRRRTLTVPSTCADFHAPGHRRRPHHEQRRCACLVGASDRRTSSRCITTTSASTATTGASRRWSRPRRRRFR